MPQDSPGHISKKLTGAVRHPVQRVLGILLDKATCRILVQDAG
jgi:hypothetical protein